MVANDAAFGVNAVYDGSLIIRDDGANSGGIIVEEISMIVFSLILFAVRG